MNKTAAKPASPVIPDRLYFRIGDVAKLCGVETYVLRFWETEFPQLKPGKSGTGQRLYRKRDVEWAIRIKQMLHDEGFTIAGARQQFKAELRQSQQPDSHSQLSRLDRRRLDSVRGGLSEILHLLDDGANSSSGKRKLKRKGANGPVHKMRGSELFSE
jgi:DNA-binding transcriptional MerR regulator